MNQVVLASNNEGKLNEFHHLFAHTCLSIVPQKNFHVSEVAETGTTFVENAIIKARHAAQITQKPAIADDSGLEIDAMQGQPGIYSARYISPNATPEERMQGVLQELKHVPDAERTARFQCVLVYMRHHLDPSPLIAQASWEGQIAHQLTGEHGHGYDPIFYVPSHQCSAAELLPDIKNQISHRALALKKLIHLMQDAKIID
tara:strand:+ start:6544 stop:7149 length:606 start_codon:yes stop_codon:yes gene_type:complete